MKKAVRDKIAKDKALEASIMEGNLHLIVIESLNLSYPRQDKMILGTR